MAQVNEVRNKINEGWEVINQNAIRKLQSYLSTGNSQVIFSKKEYMNYYTQLNSLMYAQDYLQPVHYEAGGGAEAALPKVLRVHQQLPGPAGPARSPGPRGQRRGTPQGTTDRTFLVYHKQQWKNHQMHVKWMQKFFQYLDRFYVEINSVMPLTDQGYKLFKVVVFNQMNHQIISAVLDMVNKEREGILIDDTLVKDVVEIFLFLSTGDAMMQDSVNCKKALEEKLLEGTREFYQRMCQSLLEKESLSSYLILANKFYNEEKSRCERYLTWDVKEQLLMCFREEMLISNQASLLERESGVQYLLQQDKRDDLSLLYDLYCETPAHLQPIALAFKQHILQLGGQFLEKLNSHNDLIKENNSQQNKEQQKIKDLVGNSQIIDQLIELLDKFVSIVKKCFKSSQPFERSRQLAFETFMNSGRDEQLKVSMAEMLAAYTDNILRKGTMSKLQNEAEFEEVVAKVVHLFTHLIDKDLFVEVYRSYLAKRLLNEKSQSVDNEKIFISHLKMSCGPQFTKKLEGMLTDLNLANEEMKAFSAHCQANSQLQDVNTDYKVTVLTTSYWPSYRMVEIHIPKELDPCINAFKLYYQQKHGHRVIQWCYSLGTGTVNGKFAQDKSYDLVLGTYQICILLMFNNKKEISFAEIKEKMNFDDEQASKNIKSFMIKQKVLQRVNDSQNPAFTNTDVFAVNDSFTSQIKKVNLPIPQIEEVYKKEVVQEDRSIAIEAAIVRIMKSRKKLEHTNLVKEVLQTLQLFKPDPQQIKQKVEHLIEREYLERDPDDKSVYRYLA